MILVAFWWDYAPGASIVSVTDSAGNSYHPVLQTPVGHAAAPSNAFPDPDWSAWIYVATNVVGGNNVKVTVTTSYANMNPFSMAVMEYANASGIDATSTSGGMGGRMTSGSAMTMHADELMVAVAVLEGGCTGAPGYTVIYPFPDFCVEEQRLFAAGSYGAEFVMTTNLPNLQWESGMATLH